MASPESRAAPITVLCVGGTNLDRMLKAHGPLHAASSNPCSASESPGGVARNVAENLARLGVRTQLVSLLGRDAAADVLLQGLHRVGIDTQLCMSVAGGTTGSYTAVLDAQGQLVMGMADMALIETLTPEHLQATGFTAVAAQARLWMADMNLPATTLAWLAQQARELGKRLVMLAVSDPKINRLPASLRGVDSLVLNAGELAALCALRHWPVPADGITADAVRTIFTQLHLEGLRALVVTRGAAGVLCIEAGDAQASHLLPELPADLQVVDVNGAGDSFCAGLCASILRYPDEPLAKHAQRAMRLPLLTVQSAKTVSEAITPELI
jgi:pseudouridine kinase